MGEILRSMRLTVKVSIQILRITYMGEILRSMRLTVKVSLLAIEQVMVKTALQTAKAESFARTFRWEAGF